MHMHIDIRSTLPAGSWPSRQKEIPLAVSSKFLQLEVLHALVDNWIPVRLTWYEYITNDFFSRVEMRVKYTKKSSEHTIQL